MAGGLIKTGSMEVLGEPINERTSSLDRVDLTLAKFLAAIKTKGYKVTWEKAMFCPNRAGTDPKDHNIACTLCDGSGFLYYDSVDTIMLMTSVTVSEQYYAFGRFDTGRKNVTASPECRLSFWDKLTLRESVGRFTELLFRQPDTMNDKAKYSVLDLVNVSWVDRAGDVAEAVLGFDVSIDADTGALVWASDDNRPDDRSYYSVSYEYHPEYVVTDLPHHIRDTQILGSAEEGAHQTFPVQAVAQLNFLTRDQGEDSVGSDNRHNPF